MANRFVSGWFQTARKLRMLWQCLAAGAGVGLLTFYGAAFQVNLATMSFLYLLLVVAAATVFGFWQASIASLLAVACLDYYFTPPIFTFNISDSQDFVALAAFEVTALIIGRLSAKELRKAREATAYRTGMEQLYELSRNSLLLDLRQPPGPQLVVLIQRTFKARAVSVFDFNLGRQDQTGEWKDWENELARECYLRGSGHDDRSSQTWQRVLTGGQRPVGALVVRGDLSPIVIDGLAALAAVALDRCQAYEKEESAGTAVKSEQLRGAVLDALAHEIKTPLTSVQTASSGLLELGGLTAQQHELASLIEKGAARLEELCSRLLKTARLESNQTSLHAEQIGVTALVSEVLRALPPENGLSRIKVAENTLSLLVNADRGMLAMILTQFIDNARKYSTPGTPIEIAARESRSETLISVHNFGPVIRIEDRERIFERFYRSSDLKDSVAGTGIGLSVARKAAEAHHGHVWVISDEREGTTFFLSLPNSEHRRPI